MSETEKRYCVRCGRKQVPDPADFRCPVCDMSLLTPADSQHKKVWLEDDAGGGLYGDY